MYSLLCNILKAYTITYLCTHTNKMLIPYCKNATHSCTHTIKMLIPYYVNARYLCTHTIKMLIPHYENATYSCTYIPYFSRKLSLLFFSIYLYRECGFYFYISYNLKQNKSKFMIIIKLCLFTLDILMSFNL